MISQAKQRNHVIDIARAASIVMVVVFHALLYRIGLADGRPTVTPWAPPHWMWVLSWVLMCIPVFFIAGGFGHALTIDRMRRERSGYGHYLANRGRRLVGPLLVFVTVWAVVATAAAWLGFLEPAVTLSRAFMQLLWFLTVYLVIVGIAPGMVTLNDRFGTRVMIALAALAAVVDAWSFGIGNTDLRYLNVLIVWPLVHQFGIAFQRGWLRRGPSWTPWAAVGAGVAGILVLIFGFGYPGSSVGLADIPIANVQPPTLAMGFLGLAQTGVMALLDRSGVWAHISPRFERLLGITNALMMSIYLWHIPCIVIAGLAAVLVSMAWPPAAVVLLNQLTVAGLALLIVAALVPLIGRLEYRVIPPLGAHQRLLRAVTAYVVLVVGTAMTWLNGTVLHPAAPLSTVGVCLVWLGSWLMARAADSSADALV
ncbi:acyltransferase family protein [Nigerium massiliense]|uniref:acyltransferase family protein n=1 Tax=Nigerium massiliense TaxID=1522317 RepID=UPI0005909255|nr:acyltransferase family protein [Nigerium massiliense]